MIIVYYEIYSLVSTKSKKGSLLAKRQTIVFAFSNVPPAQGQGCYFEHPLHSRKPGINPLEPQRGITGHLRAARSIAAGSFGTPPMRMTIIVKNQRRIRRRPPYPPEAIATGGWRAGLHMNSLGVQGNSWRAGLLRMVTRPSLTPAWETQKTMFTHQLPSANASDEILNKNESLLSRQNSISIYILLKNHWIITKKEGFICS